jgi:hypothetical protein
MVMELRTIQTPIELAINKVRERDSGHIVPSRRPLSIDQTSRAPSRVTHTARSPSVAALRAQGHCRVPTLALSVYPRVGFDAACAIPLTQ